MALILKSPAAAPVTEERRRYQRVKVHILGRYMLQDRREFRIIDNGFAMTVSATPRKRDKLAAQLTWLANRKILNLPEDRRHDRIVPRNPIARLTLADGRVMNCRIIDLSLSGAAVSAEYKPEVGSQLMLGTVQGQVVRHLEDGFAIEFAHPQLPETVEDSVTAR
jgi:hypothetical protein